MSRQQARKEAATAARDLLKVDAARVRKASAASTRKGAAAMQKGAVAATTLVRNGAAATPARSFTDGSFFFNGSAGDFFSSPGPSSQPWSQSSDPSMWGTNATPHGGFTNLIQPQLSQNFIFGGEASQYATFRPTQDEQSEEGYSTPISTKDNSTYVNVDNEEEAPRTEENFLDPRKRC